MSRKTVLAAFLLLLSITVFAQEDSVRQRIILIGDAGEMHHGTNVTVDAVKRTIDLNKGKNTVLFLGDNIYPLGLPDAADRRYPAAKEIIDYQANLLRDTKANGIFIPGNHDWSKHKPNGWDVIRNQQQYIDSLQMPNVQFLPKDGCPGPVGVPLGDDVLLIVFDSEWWLYPGRKPGLESSCDCKSEDEVLTAVTELAALHPGKLLVFAMHHPFRSHGIHGGYYTIKQHIFPLTDAQPHLYLPLPVIGSVYPLVRGVFGTREDLPHPLYRKMVKGVEEALPAHAPVVFVSGHDHSLQLLKDGQRHYVVSGSGSKENRVKYGKGSVFATHLNGFSVLEVMQDGRVRVQFYTDRQTTPVHTQELLNIREHRERSIATPVSEIPATITIAADTQYTHAGKLKRAILGGNYREVWATPVTLPVLRLDTLKILKRGGGMQTRSLRMEDRQGREWVLRSLRKWPATAIPEPLRETLAREVVQDQISASNPYGPLAVAALAEKAGIPHATPRFVYLPDDTALGIYRKDFANAVYLFEEREPDGHKKTYNTTDLLEKLQKDNDNRVHQESLLNARLLDLFMADWDRHEDQWRWYAEKKKKQDIFYPIPRDRDQAFFVNEGILPRIMARSWILPTFQGFRTRIPDVKSYSFSTRFFDRSFLNELDEQQWRQAARSLVQKMDDSAIYHAVTMFPDTIRAQVQQRMITTLQARRAILETEALKYYRFLSRTVNITGSAKNEQFTITGLSDGKVQVVAEKINKKGEIEQTLYDRQFDPAVTKEIDIYGLGGEDQFLLRGAVSPIRIRLIGGREKDTYTDQTSGNGKRVLIYDLVQSRDSFALTQRSRTRLSSNPEVIRYDRRAFKYNKLMPLVAGGYNLDDGLLLGLGFQYTGHGFRKEPFAVKHKLTGAHSLATNAYNFRYEGQFTDVIGKNDLLINASAKAPDNTINFFGIGNETAFEKITDKAIRYYRSRVNFYTFEALMQHHLAQQITVSLGPAITSVTLDGDDNQGRYLSKYAGNQPDSAALFKPRLHGALRAGLNIDTRDHDIITTRGLLWNTSLNGNKGLNSNSHDYTQLRSDMSIYASFGLPASVVLIARLGGGHTWGRYEFFQALTVGGAGSIRGYRNNRFAGRSMVYNNLEARFKLFDFASYLLPGSVGLIAFHDVGRVWADHASSRRWHNGYGGGLYISPVNMFMISAMVGASREETLPYISFGFKF